MNRSRPVSSPARQRGAALGISLLMLVIVVLLGIAAVRATQVELRLSQNAESRLNAQQNAESINAYVQADASNVPANDDASYVACFVGSSAPTTMTATLAAACSSPTRTIVLSTDIPELIRQHGYVVVQRVPPLFVEVTVLRDAAASADDYDFARFSFTGGFDRGSEGMSAAEINEGRLYLHVKPQGLTYE